MPVAIWKKSEVTETNPNLRNEIFELALRWLDRTRTEKIPGTSLTRPLIVEALRNDSPLAPFLRRNVVVVTVCLHADPRRLTRLRRRAAARTDCNKYIIEQIANTLEPHFLALAAPERDEAHDDLR
jgi:hypothetical protein